MSLNLGTRPKQFLSQFCLARLRCPRHAVGRGQSTTDSLSSKLLERTPRSESLHKIRPFPCSLGPRASEWVGIHAFIVVRCLFADLDCVSTAGGGEGEREAPVQILNPLLIGNNQLRSHSRKNLGYSVHRFRGQRTWPTIKQIYGNARRASLQNTNCAPYDNDSLYIKGMQPA